MPFPATPVVSQSTSASLKTRVNKVSFGDGYETRAGDGLNTVQKTYNLMWKSIPETDRVILDDFFTEEKGVGHFAYTPPNGSELNWTCDDWSWTHGENDLVDFRATLVQSFNP